MYTDTCCDICCQVYARPLLAPGLIEPCTPAEAMSHEKTALAGSAQQPALSWQQLQTLLQCCMQFDPCEHLESLLDCLVIK